MRIRELSSTIVIIAANVKESFVSESNGSDLSSKTGFVIVKWAAAFNIIIKIENFSSKFGSALTNSNTKFIALVTIKPDYSVEAIKIDFQSADSNFE